MTPRDKVVIEVIGEGQTDVGFAKMPGPPNEGVVPILVHNSAASRPGC